MRDAIIVLRMPTVPLLGFADGQPELPAAPRLAELDPATRASLLLALLGIILAGVGLIVIVILGGRMVRRWSRFSTPSRPVPKPSRPHVPIDLSTLEDDSNVTDTSD
jgi:hypothetical protein